MDTIEEQRVYLKGCFEKAMDYVYYDPYLKNKRSDDELDPVNNMISMLYEANSAPEGFIVAAIEYLPAIGIHPMFNDARICISGLLHEVCQGHTISPGESVAAMKIVTRYCQEIYD